MSEGAAVTLDEFFAGLEEIEGCGIADDLEFTVALRGFIDAAKPLFSKGEFVSDPRWIPMVRRNAKRVLNAGRLKRLRKLMEG